MYDKMQRPQITFRSQLDGKYFGSQVNPKPKMPLVAN